MKVLLCTLEGASGPPNGLNLLVRREHGWDAVGSAYDALYEQVLAEHGASLG